MPYINTYSSSRTSTISLSWLLVSSLSRRLPLSSPLHEIVARNVSLIIVRRRHTLPDSSIKLPVSYACSWQCAPHLAAAAGSWTPTWGRATAFSLTSVWVSFQETTPAGGLALGFFFLGLGPKSSSRFRMPSPGGGVGGLGSVSCSGMGHRCC